MNMEKHLGQIGFLFVFCQDYYLGMRNKILSSTPAIQKEVLQYFVSWRRMKSDFFTFIPKNILPWWCQPNCKQDIG